MIKTIPKTKKCKKTKWLSEEALQIVEKREAKDKGEKERYIHLNAEFQGIARRDKKAFISEQCKETEWERLELSSRKLEIPRYQGDISCKDGHIKGQKQQESNKSRRY